MAEDRHQLRVLKRALDGDAEAFIRLCNRYAEALYRYLYFRLGSVFAAEETTVQVLVRAWESLPSDPRQTALPYALWLFQVAHDVVSERNEQFSRLGIHPPRPPLVAWSGSAGDGPKPLLHPRFLAQAVMQLDDISQQVILLRFVTRLSHRDVALVIEDTNTGSRVLQFRGLLALRETLTRKKMSELAYASDYVGTATFCLDRIITARWEMEECLEHTPQYGESLEQLLSFAVMVRGACSIGPRRSFLQNLRKQLLKEIGQSRRRPVKQPRIWRWISASSQRMPMPVLASFTLALMLFFGVIGASAIFVSIDRAAPGDRLYELDLRFERAYRAFLSSTDSRAQFSLDLTNERLSEAEKLAHKGDSSGVRVALVAYSLEVSRLASSRPPVSESTDGLDLDQVFSGQQQRLDKLLVTSLNTSSASSGSEIPYVTCDGADDGPRRETPYHPVGLTLAAQHGISYEEVINWVCGGHSFGEIVLALASVDSSHLTAEDLFLLKAQLGGWGRLWEEMAQSEEPANRDNAGNGPDR